MNNKDRAKITEIVELLCDGQKAEDATRAPQDSRSESYFAIARAVRQLTELAK